MRNYLKSLIILVLYTAIGLSLNSCGNTQYTNKLDSNPFVSPLFGSVTKTLAVSVNPGDKISWMGLQWAADYKFFSIQKITVNGTVINVDAPDPTKTFSNITINQPASFSGNTQANFNNQMLITVTYRPTVAIESDLTPHEAFLLIHFEAPKTGIVRLALNGYTRGISVSKCTRSPSSMEAVPYQILDGTIDLYICDSNGVPASQVTAGAPGEKTNIAPVPIEGNITFYKPDEETVCFLGENPEGAAPSIPNFDLPIPKGISEATDELGTLPVRLKKGLTGECLLKGGTDLECDSVVELDILNGGVPVSPLTVSNKRIENPEAADCLQFGEIQGEGDFGDDSLTLIGWGEVLENGNTLSYNIDGALVVAVIRLSL